VKEFEVVVDSDERGRVFIVLPFDPSAEWGSKRRHYVRGEVAGAAFEGSLGSRGGKAFMPLNKELRERGGIEPGARVTVRMEPADEAPSADVPPELEQALGGDAEARRFFDGLSTFYRNQYAEWVAGAKQAETRESRAEQVRSLLREGKKQR
jgi:Bacteriocin-protection, YdeI or OmpD-Associated/Domain of unknown function (DUF1905)